MVLTDNETEALALNIDSGDNLVSSIVWTAPRSDTYFIIVNGRLNDSYIFTVKDEASARSPVPGQTTTPGISPTTPPSAGALTFASVSAGSQHTCGVTTSRAAYSWGFGQYGQLGDGSATISQMTPVAVSGGLTFASLSAGNEYTCGVTTSGAAYCWGEGEYGQLGNGSERDQARPVTVSGRLTFAAVTAGEVHSCGVTTTGDAYCWGQESSGALGDGSGRQQFTPASVAPPAGR